MIGCWEWTCPAFNLATIFPCHFHATWPPVLLCRWRILLLEDSALPSTPHSKRGTLRTSKRPQRFPVFPCAPWRVFSCRRSSWRNWTFDVVHAPTISYTCPRAKRFVHRISLKQARRCFPCQWIPWKRCFPCSLTCSSFCLPLKARAPFPVNVASHQDSLSVKVLWLSYWQQNYEPRQVRAKPSGTSHCMTAVFQFVCPGVPPCKTVSNSTSCNSCCGIEGIYVAGTCQYIDM